MFFLLGEKQGLQFKLTCLIVQCNASSDFEKYRLRNGLHSRFAITPGYTVVTHRQRRKYQTIKLTHDRDRNGQIPLMRAHCFIAEAAIEKGGELFGTKSSMQLITILRNNKYAVLQLTAPEVPRTRKPETVSALNNSSLVAGIRTELNP